MKKNTETAPKAYLTETEVSARYGLGIRFLRLARMRGNGPRWAKYSGALGKSGGRVIYKSSDIEIWIASRPQGGEAIDRPEAVWPQKETR
jgi:hypothetical protein